MVTRTSAAAASVVMNNERGTIQHPGLWAVPYVGTMRLPTSIGSLCRAAVSVNRTGSQLHSLQGRAKVASVSVRLSLRKAVKASRTSGGEVSSIKEPRSG